MLGEYKRGGRPGRDDKSTAEPVPGGEGGTVPGALPGKGELRSDQQDAVEALLVHTSGILHATTAFGKTVAAIGLIAARKVNSLILVHNKALLDQWKQRLETFLELEFQAEEAEKKRGRKKAFSPFGTLDSTGNSLHGMVDVALMQSCFEDNEAGVKPFVRDYGMVIVDECHHIPAVTFERVLRHVNARWVYGLTATPTRKDGLQGIIYMQCGKIRYTADAKRQIASQTFDPFAVVDGVTTWYGAVNYLAHTSTEEFALRVTDSAIADSLMTKLLGDKRSSSLL